jgi:hypothetical protein
LFERAEPRGKCCHVRALAREHGGRLPHGEGWIEGRKTMTREEISQAREIAQACEASNYRSCEY